MSKESFTFIRRRCSPLAAMAAGTAVCLSNGTALAISGNVASSNGGRTVFNLGDRGINLFGSQAGFYLSQDGTEKLWVSSHNALRADRTGGQILYHAPAGVQVSALASFFFYAQLRPSQSNNYLAMRFDNGGTKYGWVHCVSTDAAASQLVIDTWCYNASGGGIKTLDESITPKKLILSDGRVKLNWANTNEEGIARYEVQRKGADGAWAAVDSATPGAGSYAATVSGGGEYRLQIESSNGTTRPLAF